MVGSQAPQLGDRPQRSRRSCLVVPGSSAKMAAKASTLPADQIILDLEDSVAPGEKEVAREVVAWALCDSDWGTRTRAVRVNDCTTGWILRDIEQLIIGAGEHIDVIVVPKVQDRGQVEFIEHLIAQLEAEQGLEVGRIGLEFQIEDARGLVNIASILAASRRVETVILGPGDLSAALGMPSLTIGEEQPNYPGDHWHWVLVTLLVHARNAGVQAVDGPYARIRDVDGFEAAAGRSRTLGFDGKWVLHPDQIESANRIYGISLEAFERASDILDAYAHATEMSRVGAVMFGDEMVDEATRKMAEANVVRGRAQGLQARRVATSVPFHERVKNRT